METKDILKKIRTDHQITQDEMAEKLAVTRQAVSRWEQGESIPNIDTLKQTGASTCLLFRTASKTKTLELES